MTGVALVLAGLAALVHVYIFWLEAVAWMRPSTRAVFGIASEDDARVTRSLAYNQGFYNLMLAIVTLVGIAMIAAGSSSGSTAAGAALVFAGCGSMAVAALVLVTASRDHAGAAAKQGVLPLLAVVALAVALVTA